MVFVAAKTMGFAPGPHEGLRPSTPIVKNTDLSANAVETLPKDTRNITCFDSTSLLLPAVMAAQAATQARSRQSTGIERVENPCRLGII